MIVIKQFKPMGKIETSYRYKVEGLVLNEEEDGNVLSVIVKYVDGNTEIFCDILSVEVM